MVEIDSKLLNQPVFVRKTDGYEKCGILLKIEPTYIVLKYFDSREVVVLNQEISKIEAYQNHGGRT